MSINKNLINHFTAIVLAALISAPAHAGAYGHTLEAAKAGCAKRGQRLPTIQELVDLRDPNRNDSTLPNKTIAPKGEKAFQVPDRELKTPTVCDWSSSVDADSNAYLYCAPILGQDKAGYVLSEDPSEHGFESHHSTVYSCIR